MYDYMLLVAQKTGLSIADSEHEGDIVPYHYGFGFFPMAKCTWLEKGRIGAVGYVYLKGTEPGTLIQNISEKTQGSIVRH